MLQFAGVFVKKCNLVGGWILPPSSALLFDDETRRRLERRAVTCHKIHPKPQVHQQHNRVSVIIYTPPLAVGCFVLFPPNGIFFLGEGGACIFRRFEPKFGSYFSWSATPKITVSPRSHPAAPCVIAMSLRCCCCCCLLLLLLAAAPLEAGARDQKGF